MPIFPRPAATRPPHRARPLTAALAVVLLLLIPFGTGDQTEVDLAQQTDPAGVVDRGVEYEKTGYGSLVEPTIPVTPSVATEFGTLEGDVRIFDVTAEVFEQQIATFPLQTATVWGYNGSTPGPTLIAYEGETVRLNVTNDLPDPTTVHFHGMHSDSANDGVPLISQQDLIEPGQTYTYEFTPGHVGTFAYHAHTDDAVQELRGLNGAFIVLPEQQYESVHADVDVMMTLEEFAFAAEGALVNPFPDGGEFPFKTINGKTGDASGGTIEIDTGDLVRIRVYNASNRTHSMHMHGHDIVLVAKNGHAVPPVRETTQTVSPGDFVMLEFRANNPGNWVFHCHFPHHTSNMQSSGVDGAPVGMTRIFHYAGAPEVPAEYFTAPDN